MPRSSTTLQQLVHEATRRELLTKDMERQIFDGTGLTPNEVVDGMHAKRILAMLEEQKKYRHLQSMPETVVHDLIVSLIVGRTIGRS